MMKENDIKEILDDKFESMAPDLVNKICEDKIEKNQRPHHLQHRQHGRSERLG